MAVTCQEYSFSYFASCEPLRMLFCILGWKIVMVIRIWFLFIWSLANFFTTIFRSERQIHFKNFIVILRWRSIFFLNFSLRQMLILSRFMAPCHYTNVQNSVRNFSSPTTCLSSTRGIAHTAIVNTQYYCCLQTGWEWLMNDDTVALMICLLELELPWPSEKMFLERTSVRIEFVLYWCRTCLICNRAVLHG